MLSRRGLRAGERAHGDRSLHADHRHLAGRDLDRRLIGGDPALAAREAHAAAERERLRGEIELDLRGLGERIMVRKKELLAQFEGGKLPMGHMHSDYLQIALERGVPTLIAWLVLLGIYAAMLWRTRLRASKEDWIGRGIVLGALGGLLGFMSSGAVHYNWGDSEVVMIFYLIMGLSLVVERSVRTGSGSDRIKDALS